MPARGKGGAAIPTVGTPVHAPGKETTIIGSGKAPVPPSRDGNDPETLEGAANRLRPSTAALGATDTSVPCAIPALDEVAPVAMRIVISLTNNRDWVRHSFIAFKGGSPFERDEDG